MTDNFFRPRPEIKSPFQIFYSLSAKTLSEFLIDKIFLLTQLLTEVKITDFQSKELENPKKKKRIVQGLQVMAENEGINYLISCLPNDHLKVLFYQIFPGNEAKELELQSEYHPPTINFYKKRITKRFLQYGIFDACQKFHLSNMMLKYLILQFFETRYDSYVLGFDPNNLEDAQFLIKKKNENEEEKEKLDLLLSQVLNAFGTMCIFSRCPRMNILMKISKELNLNLSDSEIKSKNILVSKISFMSYVY